MVRDNDHAHTRVIADILQHLSVPCSPSFALRLLSQSATASSYGEQRSEWLGVFLVGLGLQNLPSAQNRITRLNLLTRYNTRFMRYSV